MDLNELQRRDPLAELAALEAEEDRRAREALKCYRPAKQIDFHMSCATETILSGGKRSGKTTGVAAEFAARVLGVPIIGKGNKPIKRPWPVSTRKDPRLYWVIGWDVDHIGQTIYAKLFEPGLFRIIRDKATGKWRTYNPASEDDSGRYSESEPAGPLIPERFIDTTKGVNGFVWENAGARNFSQVFLKNGAIIRAYPSSSKHAKQGDAVDGIWIDEDIQMPEHLKEWQDRLTTNDGWFMWSVWPHTRNDALIKLIDRAAECKEDQNPHIQHFNLVMSENPFLSENNKKKALARMGSDEEIARRDRGDLLLDTLCMYDFVPGVHLISKMETDELREKADTGQQYVRKIWNESGRFPREWTRYIAVDPSHTRTAVLFGVVPPPEENGIEIGDLLIIEDEIIVARHSAEKLAEVIRPIALGKNFEAFIMDQQMGRQTRVGTDKTVFQVYSEAFAKYGIKSRLTKSSFIPGCNVPSSRYIAVRQLMALREGGSPSLMFVESRTFGTQKEFGTYRKKQLFVAGQETLMDEPANPRKHDAMAALEYMSAYLQQAFASGTAYVEPSAYGGQGSPAYRKAMNILQKQREKDASYVHLGPGHLATV